MPHPDMRPPIQKFTTVGQVASGPFRGIRKGKFESNLVQIGEVTYGSSRVLDDKLGDVPLGTFVTVTYTGMVQPAREGAKAYKNYTFQFGNETKTVSQLVTTKPEGGVTTEGEEQNLQFLLLLSRLKLKKGDQITGILKSACELANDPYEALKSAVTQMGLSELLEDKVPF